MSFYQKNYSFGAASGGSNAASVIESVQPVTTGKSPDKSTGNLLAKNTDAKVSTTELVPATNESQSPLVKVASAEPKRIESARQSAAQIQDAATAIPSSEVRKTAPKIRSEKWLSAQNSKHYVAQIASSTIYTSMVDFAATLPTDAPLAIYPFRVSKKGKMIYGLSTGIFTSRANAMAELPRLTELSQHHGVWVRNISEINAAIASLQENPLPGAVVEPQIDKSLTIKVAAGSTDSFRDTEISSPDSVELSDTGLQAEVLNPEAALLEGKAQTQSLKDEPNRTKDLLKATTPPTEGVEKISLAKANVADGFDKTAPKILSETWLQTQQPNFYVAQVASSTDYDSLVDFAGTLPTDDPAVIYASKLSTEGQLSYGLSTGLYNSSSTAMAELPRLIDLSQHHGVWVRKVSDITSAFTSLKTQQPLLIPDEPSSVIEGVSVKIAATNLISSPVTRTPSSKSTEVSDTGTNEKSDRASTIKTFTPGAELKSLESETQGESDIVQTQSSIPSRIVAKESATTETRSDSLQLLSEKWLQAQQSNHYIAQIASSTNYNSLVDFAGGLPKDAPIAIYPFKLSNKGYVVYGLSTGLFKTKRNAEDELQRLTELSKHHGVWVRKVSDIDTDLASLREKQLIEQDPR